MELLLDTHALLWWLSDDPALGKSARAAMEDMGNTVFVSAASAWEIATKVRIDRLPGAASLAAAFADHIDREGFEPLPITIHHAASAGLLAGAHKDPFDRMLIAQALSENLTLVTNEKLFETYGVRRIW